MAVSNTLYVKDRDEWRSWLEMYDNYLTGLQEDEEIGLQKGKLEGIELALELKFGANGLTLMDKVRMISDIERLTRFQQRIKAAQTVDELRKYL